MKIVSYAVFSTSLILGLLQNSQAATQEVPLKTSAQSVYLDIKKHLGVVPTFVKFYPEANIAHAWQKVKELRLADNTALSEKFKSLIEVAIDSQIPCPLCLHMSVEMAKVARVSDGQIRESIALAGHTRHWSTFFNGAMMDEAAYRKEIDAVITFTRQRMTFSPVDVRAQPPEAPDFKNRAEALLDVRRSLGSIPTFITLYPKNGVVGAWREMKNLQLAADTNISPKYKELLGLAVAAQIPCSYCVYFHGESAKLHGATEEEISETLAIASIERQWAAIISGSQPNELTFKREIAQMTKHLKAQQSKMPGRTQWRPDPLMKVARPQLMQDRSIEN